MTLDPESEKALLDIIADGVSASANSLAAASHTNWVTQTLSITANKNGSVESLQARLAGKKDDHYGAFMSMPGAVFLLMMPKNRAAGLAKAFLSGNKPRPGSTLPREGVCVAEIANIVVNAIANTIADACGATFLLSAPMMILADKELLLKKAMEELKTSGETFAIMAYVSMSSEALSSDCTVVVLLSPACRSRILKALEH
jgi:chemotaxis protein CheY-P-specific phosphatase CheC